MADKVKIHPITPHQKRIFEVADALKSGKVAVFPTDTQYAIGCVYSNKKGIDQIRAIRKLDDSHLLTLLCDSLTGISKFAHLRDDNFKIVKKLIPGPYTFILPATKELPKLIVHPKRKTVGFRVPDYPICQKLIAELGGPIIATTAKLPDWNGKEKLYLDREELIQSMEKFVDVIIDDQQDLSVQESTVIDLTSDNPVIVRKGIGYEQVEEVLAQLGREVEV
ncbi:threonylcarbamoyl-AMP synthase [bacterium]|nr:MAG: threonylcarbamoyl-AMP synthase [bacterium]